MIIPRRMKEIYISSDGIDFYSIDKKGSEPRVKNERGFITVDDLRAFESIISKSIV